MDLMAAIQEFRSSPEQVAARRARREARGRFVYDRLATALNKPSATVTSDPEVETLHRLMREAAGWNLSKEDDVEDGQPIGGQHPGAAALLLVRQALAEYSIPTEVDLRYHGIRRAVGHGAFGMNEGIVFVQATLHSMSGPRHHVDIPVIVRQGRALAPSILLHNGNPRILTQNTIDDILSLGEFTAQIPDRPHMFAPGPDKGATAPRREVPRLAPNMFAVLPSRSMIASAVRGIHVEGRQAELAVLKQVLETPGAASTDAQGRVVYRGELSGGRPVAIAQPAGQGYEVAPEGASVYDALARTFYNDVRDRSWTLGAERTAAPRKKAPASPPAPPAVQDQVRAAIRRLKDHNMVAYDQYVGAGAFAPCAGGFTESQAQRILALVDDVMKGPKDERPGYIRPYAPTPTPELPSEDAGDEGFSKFESAPRRGFYQPDVVPEVKPGQKDIAGADGSHLDPAERPRKDHLAPGQRVSLKREAVARDRGGATYKLPKGSRGVVIRDVDGVGRVYYVRFEELGFAAHVPKEALSA